MSQETAPTPELAIRVEGLTKKFGSLVAVDSLSFQVRRGEVFGILGPNGAGKTTLLETIEGLQKPTSGRALVLGVDTHHSPDQVKERIGIQLQASAYFDYLTLTEVLTLFGNFYSRRAAPRELLGRVGLLEKARVTVGKLSGGQKQRFTIAAALVNDPELVLLDEPTTGLDPQARRSLWELIQQIHGEGRTVVLTTHYMEEAQFLCQRVAIMDRGKLAALDSPTSLIRQLPTPYQIKVMVTGSPPAQELAGLDGVTSATDLHDGVCLLTSTDAPKTLPQLLAWAQGKGVELRHIEVITATLEDVFLALTGHQLRD